MNYIYKRVFLLTLLIVAVPALSACNKLATTPTSGNQEVVEETSTEKERPIKEFSMTSFVEVIDEEYFPQFSTKELKVNKGDLVRIKVTVTAGEHDFKIDEFNVFSETPLNEEVVIEFVATDAGEFVYYCNKPNHRKNGHWGTLTVLE